MASPSRILLSFPMMGAVSLASTPGFVVPSFVVRELAATRYNLPSGHDAFAGTSPLHHKWTEIFCWSHPCPDVGRSRTKFHE
jgi:hypothetical protein